jgi:predicted HicB family RNase H-like nuclease
MLLRDAMTTVIEIDGHKAVIEFDPDVQMWRGEFWP